MFRGILVIAIVMLSLGSRPAPLLKKFQIEGYAQGTTYHIIYYAYDSLLVRSAVDSLLDNIDSSLSLYKPYSLVARFNRSPSGIPADRHLAAVVRKAITTYRETGGIFDITIFPLTDIWGFGPRTITGTPDSATVRSLLGCISSDYLSWKGNFLVKKKACVQLDPNGIAQGYSVDVIASFCESKGIRNYIIELGGEIRVRGRKQPGGKKLSIGIEAPSDDLDMPVMERVIWADHGAITTSGNYRRYYESDGTKISHLLDPHTGYSLRNELISVTVYAPDAITADAFDNALMGMGLQKAMAFVEKRPSLAAHFIYRKADGSVADTMTSRFRALLKP